MAPSTSGPYNPLDRDECPDLTRYIKLLSSTTVAEGGFSSIYVGTVYFQSGQVKVAIKVVRDKGRTGDPDHTATLQRRVRRESRTWYDFSHENVIQLFGLARDPSLSNVVSGLVFPWCDNGTVLEFVRKYPSVQRIPLVKGVASGLHYIHGRDAVHGDIKSANVLMSNDEPLRPLITDFGCSKFLGVRGYTTELKSSIMYLSPELLDVVGAPLDRDGRRSGTPTTQQSDVWAFGLVGAEIVGGSEVFRHIQYFRLASYLAQGGRPKKTDFRNISAEAGTVWPFLETCWETDPGNRPTMGRIVQSLSRL